MLKTLFALALLLAPLSASALEIKGLTLPDTLTLGKQTLVLNGAGIRKATIFKVSVYVGALYVEKKTQDPATVIHSPGARRVELRFLRDVEAKKIRETWEENFSKNCAADCQSARPAFDQVLGWMSEDVKEGDLQVFHVQGTRVTYEFKGASKGTVEQPALARILLESWFGKEPPNEDLKKGMLGL